MKDKNLLIATIFLVMTVLMVVPMVSAAVLTSVWNSPANYTNHTGSFTYNCTISAHAVENITVYANSSAGVMNSLQVFTNTSAAQTAWTGTVTITSSDDGAGQNFTCYADNGTDQLYSAELTGVNIMLDSTDPVCDITEVTHPRVAYKGLQNIEYSSSDAIERVSTSLTIDGPGAQSTITSTAANGPIELGSNDTKYVGDWALALTVTDRAGNTCTDSDTFKSYMPGDVEEDEADGKGNQFVIFALAAGLIWYFATKKK